MEQATLVQSPRPEPVKAKPKLNWIVGKTILWVLCLMPAASLVWKAFHNELGANPVEYITHATGNWTLRLLLVTLAITPARRLFKQPQLTRFRRPLGLFAFFYVCLHFTTWFLLDKSLSLDEMWKDVIKRPFITMGFLGFVSMVPLAITSTAGWIRRLGGKNWQRLHRLVYLCAIAGVIHYYWLVKSDVRLPVMYGVILTVLLALRLVKRPA
jgi:sulfoxide reductase heme-binding subunit YedZ